MPMDPEYDPVVTLDHTNGQDNGQDNGHQLVPPESPVVVALPAPAEALPIEAEAVPTLPAAAEPMPVTRPVAAKPSRSRPKWLIPAAIAAVGLIASGTLGYLFYSTNAKLDATKQRLVATQTSLESTKLQLSNLQQDAADKKVIADYVAMYTVDAGKVRTDYGQVAACNSYSTCRTSAQQTLEDMQTFQSDRQSANVPPALTASDGQLGDSLSAGIAALQELINGMDTDNVKKIDDGFNKLNDSMLSMAKAESALGAELK
ncbi:MAG TPA: hypothetical protein VFL29_08470 [Candidatus Dormibacteraeota bacterium]|nr:hypothetical protein [Candidatus Dormibacteraeota bacterium]